MSARRWLITAVAVGVAIVAALAVVATVGTQRSTSLAGAHAEARESAMTRVPDLLSYENVTLADDLDRALEQTTGSFTDDYQAILQEVVKPEATRRKISTTAAVRAAGVVPDTGDRDEVVVLVFVTQTTIAGKSAPSISGSRVEVTMERSGSTWKVAGLKPV